LSVSVAGGPATGPMFAARDGPDRRASTATGPYSGPFTETGTAAGTVFPNSLTSLSASFTIYSLGGAVLVKGTTIASSGTWCQDRGIGVAVSSSPEYQAAIFTANGNCRLCGRRLGRAYPDPALLDRR
jgi:hypothetical protein